MNANTMSLLLMLCAVMVGLYILVSVADDHATVEDTDFNVVCLEGVEYWFRKAGYGQILAVKMTPEGDVVACE